MSGGPIQRYFWGTDDVGKLISESGIAGDGVTLLVAILDGADNYRAKFGEPAVDRKASHHESVCRQAIGLADASILGLPRNGGGPRPFAAPGKQGDTSFFRDGVVAAVRGARSLCDAIAAAFRLHGSLHEWNFQNGLSWHHQLHSRIALFRLPGEAQYVCARARRNEIVMTPDLWKELGELHQAIQSIFQWGPVRQAISQEEDERQAQFLQRLIEAQDDPQGAGDPLGEFPEIEQMVRAWCPDSVHAGRGNPRD